MFVGYTNAALMRFVTIPKGHTIAHANMDSREMDENVKVVFWSINNYVMKKVSLYLQIIHKGIVTYISILSARKRIVKLNAGRDIWAKPHWKIFFLNTKVFLHQLKSICSSSFVGFIHPLLPDRLSYGYRNLFDVLNNKY